MQTLVRRVMKLENAEPALACSTCRTWRTIAYVRDDEPEPPVRGCPECGRVNHFIVRYRTQVLPDGSRPSRDGLTGQQLAALHEPWRAPSENTGIQAQSP